MSRQKRKPTGICTDTAFDIPCYFREGRFAYCRHFCDARKKLTQEATDGHEKSD